MCGRLKTEIKSVQEEAGNECEGWFTEENNKKRARSAFGGRILQLAAYLNYTGLQEIGKLQKMESRTAVEPEGCGGGVFSGGKTISWRLKWRQVAVVMPGRLTNEMEM